MVPTDNVDSTACGFADTATPNVDMDATIDARPDAGLRRCCTKPGEAVQHYELIRKLGEGGMGTVFLARDTRLGRRVAIKFLQERSGPALDRFLVEARATALCQHENIVVIYDVGEFDFSPYMVLEYIEGRTLRTAMDEQMPQGSSDSKSTTQWAIEQMIPVARALSAAHAMNIVHRDLKPENILISNRGLVKVVDFGIAKQVGAPLANANDENSLGGLGNVNLTKNGASPGTMMYMAPEQWLSDEIDGRTDIWAFGLILFELLVGDHPLAPVTMNALTQVINFAEPMPSAKEKRPDEAALGEIIDRCLRKRKEERYASAQELCTALEALLDDPRTPAFLEQKCPFAGLLAFQETDARRYFGRAEDIAAVTDKLENQELIAVVGASGAGKSSFIRAGVIPAFKATGKNVETYVLRPGRRPLAALADTLSFFAETSGSNERLDPLVVEKNLLQEPGNLGVCLRLRCRRRGPEHRILLVVDQFEEIFTLGVDADVRAAFFMGLLGVADDASSPLRVILSMRADFLDRLAEDRTFLSAVTRGLYFLPPMAADGLRDALVKPLERARYRCDDDALIDEILAGLVGMKSPLPILQFLATKLWEARDKEQRFLTTEAYHALGGVAGALSTHADAVVSAMSPNEQKITRAIFLRLVTPERTRAVVLFDELQVLFGDPAAVEHAVQRLADARLVVIESGDERKGKTVELIHESLIERWGKLRGWLDESEQDVQFLAELRTAAAQWEKNGQAPGFLWRDEAAQKAETWLRTRLAAGQAQLGPRELGYLQAVVRLAQRTKTRQRQIIAGTLMLAVVIALVVGGFAVNAQKQAHRADAQAARARDEARQARNATRIAAARELQSKDPTKALSLLREIEQGANVRGWLELLMQTKHAGVAERVKVHSTAVLAMAINPQGDRVVSSLSDHNLEIWNADGTGESLVLRGHEHGSFVVAWSHDGQKIASGSRDQTVRVWNADGSGSPLVLPGYSATIRSIDWSPNDKYLATVAYSSAAWIWNLDSPDKPIVLGPGAELQARAIAWHPDGKRVAIASQDGTVQVWGVEGNEAELVLRGHDDAVSAVAWSPDGRYLASAGKDKTVRIWNASGGGDPIILEGHQDVIVDVKWSPNGKMVVSGAQDKTVRLWDVSRLRLPIVLRGHDDKVTDVAWSTDGRSIVSSSLDHEVRFWDVARLMKNYALGDHERPVKYVSFSPDGQRIASGSADKTIRVWNLADRTAPLVLQGHEQMVNSVAFSPDGRKLTSCSADRTVRVWNADGTGEPLVFRGHEGEVWDASFMADGRRIVSGSEDKTVRIWSADGETPPVILRQYQAKVTTVAIAPDGQRIASGSTDRTIRIGRADGSGEPLILRGHVDSITGLCWSPDSRRIASGSDDWTVRVWNGDGTGTPLVFKGHRSTSSIHPTSAFRPDAQWIVSSSDDGSIRIWHSDGTGEAIVLHAGDSWVNSAAWSPDGKQIAAGLENGTILVWSDLDWLDKVDDDQLWKTTNYCLPLDVRERLLGFSEAQSRVDLANCERAVVQASKHP